MKNTLIIIGLILVLSTTTVLAEKSLDVVTTLPDYAFFAKEIGKEHVSVKAIVRGDQDAHFIRPKPSFATALRNADILVATGLDLELWVQTVINNSGNSSIRSGQPGYVSAATGMRLLEKPKTISRAQGGVHVHGNPHVTCSPIQMKVAASNIAVGLIKNDPENKELYLQNLKTLHNKLDEYLFGKDLVKMLGGDTLCSLAEKDKLVTFLRKKQFQGTPLIEYLGGWMGEMLPIRGEPIVTYHKNWIYFVKLFGLEEVGTVEPKPGIPPSPKHVTKLINLMNERKVGIILAANYFDEQKIKTVAARTDAEAVIVPIYTGGAKGTEDYFKLVDYWIDGLLKAAKKKGILSSK
ncbi:MAG: metal ABC transporter substrate-binding protein [Nitrosomonadaceae bacterium]